MMQRFSITTLVLALAMALAIALPVEAKKPDKPGKPNTGFKPMTCQVEVPFGSADVTDATARDVSTPAVSGVFTLTAEKSGGYNETRYTVEPGTPELNDVLCVEVRLVHGTLSDLRVRWLDCQDCGLYRATGKDLRNFNNNGEVFSAGVSVADWTDLGGEMTVAVMPKAKSDTATMMVKIGIDHP